MSLLLCLVPLKAWLPTAGKADAHPDLRYGQLLHQKLVIFQQSFNGGANVAIVKGEGCRDPIDRAGILNSSAAALIVDMASPATA
jgi:hypothetical protein